MRKKLALNFIKISRNTLVNFEQIRRLETDFVYGVLLYLGDEKLPVSRRYLANINKKLEEGAKKMKYVISGLKGAFIAIVCGVLLTLYFGGEIDFESMTLILVYGFVQGAMSN